MTSSSNLRCATVVLLLAASVQLCAQTSPPPAVAVTNLSAQTGQSPAAPGEVLREIDDPQTGDRWLLMRNAAFPGGPARMVRIAVHGQRIDPAQLAASGVNDATLPQVVIRAGDKLLVEEHTAVVDAVFEARAVAPAAVGTEFEVRLTIGGMVVRAVATGPGRATIKSSSGVRP